MRTGLYASVSKSGGILDQLFQLKKLGLKRRGFVQEQLSLIYSKHGHSYKLNQYYVHMWSG